MKCGAPTSNSSATSAKSMGFLKAGDDHVTRFDGFGRNVDLAGAQAGVAARTGQSGRFAQRRSINRLGAKAVT